MNAPNPSAYHPQALPFYLGEFEVDPATHCIRRVSEETKLEPRAMELLMYLAARQGQVVNREELEAEIWQGVIVGYDSLNNAIAKLRKAFHDNPKNPKFIHTVPKVGYRLIAEVKNSALADSESDLNESDGLLAINSYSRFIKTSALVSLLVIGIGLGAWIKPWESTTEFVETVEFPALPDKPSLVVLPLRKLSGESDQDAFSIAVSEDITNQLSRFSELFVISGNSAKAYRSSAKTPRVIGRELGIRYVLTGSMQRIGDRLSVNMQLIDAENQRQIWTEQYDRSVNDLFLLQEEIVHSVTTSLGESIWRSAADRLNAKSISDFTLYDYHLKAKQALHKFTLESNEEARQIWTKIIRQASDFPGAYVGLAWTYYLDYSAQWTKTGPEALVTSTDYLKRAAELLGEHEAIHRLLAKISQVRGDFDKALSHSERALELNPNDGELLATYAQVLMVSGKPVQAMQWINEAIRRNPHYPGWYASVRADIYYLDRNYEAAIRALNKINHLSVWDHRRLAANYAQLNRDDEAQQQVKILLEINPEFSLKAFAPKIKFQLESDKQHFLEGLAKAGLPE